MSGSGILWHCGSSTDPGAVAPVLAGTQSTTVQSRAVASALELTDGAALFAFALMGQKACCMRGLHAWARISERELKCKGCQLQEINHV